VETARLGVGGGALQMVVCGVLIGLFCMSLGLRWQVAELIGMTLALLNGDRHAGDERT
jgi:Kef-type K+ transport system membrane component KefB